MARRPPEAIHASHESRSYGLGTNPETARKAGISGRILTRSAPLGRTLSELYASQLSAKGYNVKELKLRGDVYVKEGTGELLLSREIKDIARNHNAALVLVGTYSAAAKYTYVSLKLVRTDDSRIVRSHDYALPNNIDIQRLLGAPATAQR